MGLCGSILEELLIDGFVDLVTGVAVDGEPVIGLQDTLPEVSLARGGRIPEVIDSDDNGAEVTLRHRKGNPRFLLRDLDDVGRAGAWVLVRVLGRPPNPEERAPLALKLDTVSVRGLLGERFELRVPVVLPVLCRHEPPVFGEWRRGTPGADEQENDQGGENSSVVHVDSDLLVVLFLVEIEIFSAPGVTRTSEYGEQLGQGKNLQKRVNFEQHSITQKSPSVKRCLQVN